MSETLRNLVRPFPRRPGAIARAPGWRFAAACAILAGCGDGNAKKDRERPPPVVEVAPASMATFVERVEAIGTARANEQVTLTSPVTERIVRLNFDDGGYVRKGQVIAELAQGQQTAQLTEAQARAREATQQLDRLTALRARGFATQSAYDTQSAVAAQARAQAAGARADIGDRVVRAPFAGFVSLRTISAGAVAAAGTEIATISDTSVIKLDFPVPETMLGAIAPGQIIEARAAAFPGTPFRGRVADLDAVVDPNTRAVTARARLPNPDRRLRPGMLMTVDIQTSSRTSLAVPELAIVGEGDRRFVYVVDAGGTANRVGVRTGLRSQGRIEIVEGLRPGQRVVTEGVVKLSDGIKVRVAGERQLAGDARPGRPAVATP